MTRHRVGTHDEWRREREQLLEREKELTRRSDELARARLELPWVPIDKDYRFETEDGRRTLEELFDGRSQLLIYHFMFGPEWDAGRPSCSSFADQLDGLVPHLGEHDVTLMCVSRAPLEKLQGYKRRMGWSFPWASSAGSDFNVDFGVSFTPEQQEGGAEYNYRWVERPGEEAPGVSAFVLEDGFAYHTYSCYGRGSDALWGIYGFLDRAPRGRNEEAGPAWIRRRDEYAGAPAGSAP